MIREVDTGCRAEHGGNLRAHGRSRSGNVPLVLGLEVRLLLRLRGSHLPNRGLGLVTHALHLLGDFLLHLLLCTHELLLEEVIGLVFTLLLCLKLLELLRHDAQLGLGRLLLCAQSLLCLLCLALGLLQCALLLGLALAQLLLVLLLELSLGLLELFLEPLLGGAELLVGIECGGRECRHLVGWGAGVWCELREHAEALRRALAAMTRACSAAAESFMG